MLGFSTLDWIALSIFVGAWLAYAVVLEWTPARRRSLNGYMHQFREMWMTQMLARDMRMVDAQINTSLQNGTAFFASTSLIAIGGALTVLRSTDDMLALVSALPFGVVTTRLQWEAKVLGLAIIFAYAFFKFAWSYRLFNYVAILIAAAPPAVLKDTARARTHALKAARLSASAGQHFNRGQRAFFFALGYLGWFISPQVLIAATIAVVAVTWHRQFASESRAAVMSDPAG